MVRVLESLRVLELHRKGLNPVLLIALLCITTPLIAARLYPVDIDMGSSTPRRGEIFHYWIDIKAYSSLDVIVIAVIYVPGYGWSDLQELWEGYMRAGEEKRVYGSFYIASDADVGSVVVWYKVLYYSPDYYEVMAGKKYHGDLDITYVAGSLPDPNVEYWKAGGELLGVSGRVLERPVQLFIDVEG